MALGVLNNLSAIYAENNLNNTNASLQTVLEQLSSGSRINSGADDAAGLSLVNGLEANQTALTQSRTNATEGVGLLQVADGALSQVTSLLNRAITLATEASNGTLNTTQEGAANQEYQSILSEINNIGQTTTYNQEQVFNGTVVAIYTGDSSAVGSSLDDLNIRSLSESSVGDTGGKMAYSSGSNSVFINLSTSTKNAQATDTLNQSGTTAINVNYLVKGSNGSETTASTSITVGAGTSYANTANGLISAINAAGLGMSASFATQTQAGLADGGTQTGIQITGGLISAGVDPNVASTSGILNLAGTAANSLLTQGQTVVIQSGSTAAVSIVISSTVATLTELANSINSLDTQVTASVITNSDGSLSLSLADQYPSGGALSVTTTPGTVIPQITATDVSSLENPVSLNFSASPSDTGTVGTDATATLGISGITNNPSAQLSGNVILSNGNGDVTITMNNASASADATHINLTTANSTLTGLAAALNGTSGIANSATAVATLDMSAVAGTTGLVLTSGATGTTIAGTSALTATPALGLSSIVNGSAASAGTQGTTMLAMSGGPGLTGTDALTAHGAGTGTIVITNSSIDTPGTPVSFIVGAGANDATHFYTMNDGGFGLGGNTVANLVDIMNTGAGATAAGLASAVLSGPDGNILLTSNSVGTTINATSNVVDPQAMANGAVTAGQPQNLVGSSSTGASFTMAAMVAPDLNNDPISLTGDALTGSIVLQNGNPGTALTITMDNATGSVGAATINLTTAASTLTGLMDAINGTSGIAGAAALTTALNLTAAMGANNNGLTFTTAATGTLIGVNTTGLQDTSTLNFTNPVSGGAGVHASGTVALTDGGAIQGNGGATSGAYTGSIVVSNNGVNDTFVMNSNAANVYSAGGSTFHVNSTQLSALITAINTEGSDATNGGVADLGLSAVRDASTGGIFLQGTATGNTGLNAVSSLTATMTEVKTDGSQGAAIVPTSMGASVTVGSGAYNLAGDTITGNLVIKNSGGTNATTTFVMNGASTQALENSTLGTTTVNVFGATLQALADAVNADSMDAFAGTAGVDLSATIGASGLTLTAKDTVGGLGVLSGDGASTLVDQYGTAELTPNGGDPATGATYASAVLGAAGSIGGSDALSGTIVLNNGGADFTFTMDSSSANTVGNNIHTNGFTLANLATAITNSGIGLAANVLNGALQLQSSNVGTTISVVGAPTLQDTATETFTAGSPDPGILHQYSTASVDLAGALTTAQAGDVLTGSITLTGTSGTEVFTMGGSSSVGTIAVGSNASSETLQNLAYAITNSGIGLAASVDSTGLALTMTSYNNTPIVGSSSLSDTMGNAASYASLGSFSGESDTLSSGRISFTVGGVAESVVVTSGETVSNLIANINADAATLGVNASWLPTGNNSFGDVVLTSSHYGTAGNITAASSNVTDTTTGAKLTYTAGGAYNTGVSNSTLNADSVNTALYDSSSGQTNPTGGISTEFESNASQSSGVATISYSDGAGEALNGTDLTNQTDAQSALNELNIAISDVASQDGYIGAQINTLNSISQVMSTQEENVVSAQNAIQATDYASATANMSKYEILSQTGIAALAQANSVQQEVTKLLQ